MNTFERHVLETVDKYNMIREGQTVIAAVSGGYDSLCMLNVLCRLRRLRGFDVCAVHVNHMLREEAGADEEFVLSEAQRLGIKAYTRRYNVSEYAKNNKVSFETAGRKLRYSFFEEVSCNYSDSVVATAHNANDSAESMFMHLMRGSGLTGLIGIRPVNGNIIRPLIESDRREIEKYCDESGIIPRHDCTNDSDEYRRNDIRHNVLLPVLERCSISSLSRTMNVLAADDDFLEEYSCEIADKYIRENGDKKSIPIKEFNKLHPAVKRRVLRIAIGNTDADNQVCLVHIDEIIKLAEKNYGGKTVRLPGNRTAKIIKGEIVL